jgi:hypothetical protein
MYQHGKTSKIILNEKASSRTLVRALSHGIDLGVQKCPEEPTSMDLQHDP